MKEAYYNLCVWIAEEDKDVVIEGIQLRKYLMAHRWPRRGGLAKEEWEKLTKGKKEEAVKKMKAEMLASTDPDIKRRVRKIKDFEAKQKAQRTNLGGLWKDFLLGPREERVSNKKVKTDEVVSRSLREAFDGKGLPGDYEQALALAADLKDCEANKVGLQTYADKYLGIDCSGFVNAYFQAKGKLHVDSLTRVSRTISDYAREGAPRLTLEEVEQDDCLIYMLKHGEIKKRPGHIMLVDSGPKQGKKKDTLSVVESSGNRGLVINDYTLSGGKTKSMVDDRRKKFTLFYMKRGDLPAPNPMWVKIVKPF
jgi:hypothetical protein